VLALGDDDLTEEPFEVRRAALERALAHAAPPVHVTPITRDEELARTWFDRFEGAGLDGVIAKRADLTYEPDKRVMAKIKHVRTADCVVAGYRTHKAAADAIGSLLLGLYTDETAPPAQWVSARAAWHPRPSAVSNPPRRPMAEPNSRGITIRVSGVRLPPPASTKALQTHGFRRL
jgi:ATP-dependent DNA ligase